MRTTYCGDVRKEHVSKTITVCGWVAAKRDQGGVIFLDLRDRRGLLQIVLNEQRAPKAFELGKNLKPEYVLKVVGEVRNRLEGFINPKLATGEIEVYADEVELLSKSETPPFELDKFASVSEETRLRYRYLDIRRAPMQEAIEVRHRAVFAIREFLVAQGFMEVETPVLAKSTPEGARDYLVPSRIYPGKFYALPQSPQIFKQLLMIGGVDRYFQIARCFRDEDSRADRQPEFTQLDLEMSFVGQEDIFAVTEGVIQNMWKKAINSDVTTPFPRMSYKDAMERYGCDKPDTRFGMELTNVTEIVKDCGFSAFADTVKGGGIVKGLKVEGKATELSRKKLDELTELAKHFGAKGLAWVKIEDGKVNSPIAKFMGDVMDTLVSRFEAKTGDVILMVADKPARTNAALNAIRNRLGAELKLIPPGKFNFLWITDFPLFGYDEESNAWYSEHHPFTSPAVEDLHLLESDPGKVRSSSYDLVLNGYEVASGSVRIHQSEMQQRIFKILGITEEMAKERFGFFIDALKYGTPPHAGVAPGIDRLITIMLNRETIRDVIAFPKTLKAADLMCGSPSTVDAAQLEALHIDLKLPKETT